MHLLREKIIKLELKFMIGDKMTKETNLEIKTWIREKIKKDRNIELPIKFKCKIKNETNKALLIEYNDRKFWIPKSQIVSSGSNVYQSNIESW